MIFLIRFFLIGKTSYDIPNGVIPNFVSIFLILKQIMMFFLMIQQNVMISLLAQQIVMFFLMIQQNVMISLLAQQSVMFFLTAQQNASIFLKCNDFTVGGSSLKGRKKRHCVNKGLFGPLKHASNQAFNRGSMLLL